MQSQFDELAALYEDMASWPFRKDLEIPNILALTGDVTGLSVLDFGCGTGMYSRLLKERGAGCVIGYDAAGGMLKYAKEREEEKPLGIEFVSELTASLENTFDLVLGVYVLPYASTRDELHAMCHTMASLVKPGGRLITLPIHPNYDPNPKYYEPYGFRLISGNPYAEGGKVQLELCYSNYDVKVTAYYWSDNALKTALIDAGFSSVKQIELFTSRTGSLDTADSALKNYIIKPHASILECKKLIGS